MREGFCTQAEVVRVIDADTVELEIKRRVIVRLIHPNQVADLIFDAPEKNTPLGIAAIQFVKCILSNFKGTIRLFVPAGKSDLVLDSVTFNRVAAEIWLDDQNLAELLCDNGYGRLVRRELRTTTSWGVK
jgi:endonuclease YncB( thermonuclease family)